MSDNFVGTIWHVSCVRPSSARSCEWQFVNAFFDIEPDRVPALVAFIHANVKDVYNVTIDLTGKNIEGVVAPILRALWCHTPKVTFFRLACAPSIRALQVLPTPPDCEYFDLANTSLDSSELTDEWKQFIMERVNGITFDACVFSMDVVHWLNANAAKLSWNSLHMDPITSIDDAVMHLDLSASYPMCVSLERKDHRRVGYVNKFPRLNADALLLQGQRPDLRFLRVNPQLRCVFLGAIIDGGLLDTLKIIVNHPTIDDFGVSEPVTYQGECDDEWKCVFSRIRLNKLLLVTHDKRHFAAFIELLCLTRVEHLTMPLRNGSNELIVPCIDRLAKSGRFHYISMTDEYLKQCVDLFPDAKPPHWHRYRLAFVGWRFGGRNITDGTYARFLREWQILAVLMASHRANARHPLVDSVAPLITGICAMLPAGDVPGVNVDKVVYWHRGTPAKCNAQFIERVWRSKFFLSLQQRIPAAEKRKRMD